MACLLLFLRRFLQQILLAKLLDSCSQFAYFRKMLIHHLGRKRNLLNGKMEWGREVCLSVDIIR